MRCVRTTGCQEFRSRCVVKYDQTVLSSFVIRDAAVSSNSPECYVAALGVGTKFMSATEIQQDTSGSTVRAGLPHDCS